MLAHLLSFVVNVCLLRRGPEDAPHQSAAMIIAVLANFLLLLWAYGQQSGLPAILPALQSTVIVLLATRWVLQASGKLARYTPTVFTLFASSALINLLYKASQLLVPNDAASASGSPFLLLLLLIWVWSFVIDAHIYRRALDSPFALGMLLTVLLFATNTLLLDWWYWPTVESAPA